MPAVKWLVEDQHIMLIKADNLGFEAFPSETKENWFLFTFTFWQKKKV